MVAWTDTWGTGGTQPYARTYRVNGYTTIIVVHENANQGTGSTTPLVTLNGPGLWELGWHEYDDLSCVLSGRRRLGRACWFSAEALFPFLVPRPYCVRRSRIATSAPWRPTRRACPSVGRGRSRRRGVFPKRWRGRRKRRSTC